MTSSQTPESRRRPILLLDVMDTLVWDPFRLLPGALGLSLEEFLAAREPETWPAFERGELDEATFARRYFRDERVLDVEAIRELLRTNYRWMDGMEAMLRELKDAGVSMYALSNYPVWWEIIEDELELSRFLGWDFVSTKTGVRKPQPEAYLNAARALDVEAGACLFVDDRETNCAAAVAVGMDAVRFRGADSLRRALRDRRLL